MWAMIGGMCVSWAVARTELRKALAALNAHKFGTGALPGA